MSADSKASNSKFLKGTLILTASSIVVKVIGSLNWIILSRVLGGEGIGLYQMGFPIYLMAITVSSAGVPVAISIITSEKLANKDYRGAKRVFNVSLRVLLLTGLLFSSSLFFGADWLVNNHIIRDPCVLFYYRSGACGFLRNLSGQLPWLSAGLADYDADGGQ